MVTHNRTIRRDVRELGSLLGAIIEEQTSPTTFEAVEEIRRSAIDYRRGGAESREPFASAVDGLTPRREYQVARAFTTYFELINLAEERERVRVLRSDGDAGELGETVGDAVETFGDDAQAGRVFDDVMIAPTFTAHPTEARRKTVKAKLRAIAHHLRELDERNLTTAETRDRWDQIEAEILSLWQTSQLRNRAPDPQDEARNVQWYLDQTLFDVVGAVYDELEAAVDDADLEVDVPQLFAFRSWAGSDADGNPYVTPAVTSDVLARQRELVIDRYRGAIETLDSALSQSADRIDDGHALQRSIADDRDRMPSVTPDRLEADPDEPYRLKLAYMAERLDRVGDVRPGGYRDPDELLADLDVIATTLRHSGADSVAATTVDPLRRRVQTFGFTFASHDLRDHRERHTHAVDTLLGRVGIEYRDLPEEERQAVLTDAMGQDEPVIELDVEDDLDETTATILERFRALADWQRGYGVDAVDTYCISMTEHPSHVLEVAFLADQVGVLDLPDHAGLDIVPLLETESALSRAREIMGTLFENPMYGSLVAERGDVQEVMIGYSDSNKENGFLAANWSLYSNQVRLAAVADEYDVTLRLFHGRGGSISRGGGPMNRALMALPTETVSGDVKFTVQGEAIAESYANPAIARREIDQMLNAQLRTRRRALEDGTDDVPAAWHDAMDEMAAAARTGYQDLLESDGFVPYFEQVTPIGVIDELNLGSRPTSRTEQRTPEDLRAIPWVFSWTQTRCILPGWYALATGIDAYLDGDGSMETLQEMYAEWPFFATTLDNAAMAMAKSDMEIAALYADLADPELRERFFPRITAEYERATELVGEITGRDTLVDRDWLDESLELRNPYVDPLNHLQARLLGRNDRSAIESRTLRLSVKGIAAGMKNTG